VLEHLGGALGLEASEILDRERSELGIGERAFEVHHERFGGDFGAGRVLRRLCDRGQCALRRGGDWLVVERLPECVHRLPRAELSEKGDNVGCVVDVRALHRLEHDVPCAAAVLTGNLVSG
jgi:hypothetical protein